MRAIDIERLEHGRFEVEDAPGAWWVVAVFPDGREERTFPGQAAAEWHVTDLMASPAADTLLEVRVCRTEFVVRRRPGTRP